MLRKIATYLFCALTIALFSLYLAYGYRLVEKRRGEELCTSIKVTVADSSVNRFISKEEIVKLIKKSEYNPLKRVRKEIPLADIERLLMTKSAIKSSNVSIANDGVLRARVTQRRPILRIQGENSGFYIDNEGYIFPLVASYTSYVPIVTGHIPIEFNNNTRNTLGGAHDQWVKKIVTLGEYIDHDRLWNSMIQQIEIDKDGTVTLYTVLGDQKIIFGKIKGIEEIDYKFAKLNTFYQEIAPTEGWDFYSEINLSYSDQIVCRKRAIKKKS